MTNPAEHDTRKSAGDEALEQQPVANPDADAEADQDEPSALTDAVDVDDAS